MTRKPLWVAACAVLFILRLHAQPASIAFTNVFVVDVVSGQTKPGQTVVVNGRTIAAVGPMNSVRVPPNARVIRGDGKYLIPGLWDAHVHWYHQELLPLFIAMPPSSVAPWSMLMPISFMVRSGRSLRGGTSASMPGRGARVARA